MSRIVFAGTPVFALASLRALVEAGRVPVAVYTQPDRPAGRGRRLSQSPVKEYALEHGIDVRQPRTLREADAQAEFAALTPDLLIVAAYGLILPQAVLDVPSHGCLNVHASLLPRWRGAAPIQACLLAGDTESGVCLMRMTAGLDSGPVWCERRLALDDRMTAGDLHDRLAALGGELLTDNLDDILEQRLSAREQDESKVTYAPKIRTADAELDWNLSAGELARAVRAYNPVPGAWFLHRDLRIKVFAATALDRDAGPAGSIAQYDSHGIVIACGRGAMRLEELQAAGKKRLAAREFVNQVRFYAR